jgi:membrane-bound lytic murein transglycosylase D
MLQGFLFLAIAALFPTRGLEPRIGFWKAVFAEYGERHLIVHDRIHVHLIYEVLDVTESEISLDNMAAQNELKRKAISKTQATLNEINTNPRQTWSPDAERIYGRIQDLGLTEEIASLPDRIHIQRGIKERFQLGLKRYPKYRSMVDSTLKREGIPLTIAALPLVESGYNNASRSKTGAAGIWQFMPGTGRSFLKVNKKVDQRLDPKLSTVAAARLLRSNYERLGSWPLAILAYNHGTAGTAVARDQCGEDVSDLLQCYRGPSFGYASMNFYAEFIAASQLLDAHLSSATPTGDKYIVRSGDTLTGISRKFGTTPAKLVSLNRLTDRHILQPGQMLLVR